MTPRCHPSRPHKSKGLCHACYQTQYKRTQDQQRKALYGERKRTAKITATLNDPIWEARFIRHAHAGTDFLPRNEFETNLCAWGETHGWLQYDGNWTLTEDGKRGIGIY